MKFFLKLGFVGLLFSQGFWGNEWPMPKIEYKPKTYVCYKTSSSNQNGREIR